MDDIPKLPKIDKKVDINKYFINFIKDNLVLFFMYFSLLVVYPIQKIVLPKYYGKVIHSLKETDSFVSNTYKLLIVFVVIQILYTLNYKVQGYLIPNFSEYTTKEIFSEILKGFEYNYDNIEVGEILAKVIKIPNVIYKYLDLLRNFLFSQLTIMIGCIIHYMSISTSTALVFVGLVFGVTILQIIAYKVTLNVELRREGEKDHIYQHLQDILNNLISVYVCKQQDSEKELLSDKFKPYIDVFYESLNLNFILRIIFSIFNVVSFILLNYIIYKAYRNKQISQETFISSFIITYSILGLFSESYYAVRSIIDMFSQINDTETYFNRTLSEQNSQQNEHENNNNEFQDGDIEFKNVYFKYPDSDKWALQNVSLKINQGEHVALIGQIGSGKSTVVKMLMKLVPNDMGDVTIGGKKINEIHTQTLRDAVFYIPQKPKLLNRSLYENITYGLDKNTNYEEQIYNKLEEMNLKEVADVFREKMHKPVGSDGTTLSGGQKQIVWLLRALFRNVNILILDEPTAALDPESKQLVLDAIKNIGKDKTVIIISHDPVDITFRKIEFKEGKHKKGLNTIFSFLMD